jgi:hypothetical protein
MAFEQRAMTRVRRLILAAVGFLQFYYLLARYGPYRGGGEVRKRWQTGNQALRAYLNFERFYKKPVLDDYVFALTEAANERPSAAALAQYTDDSLAGYGDEGGDTIVAQQRGLILPLVERAIAETTGAIIEVGTGNGDVIAHLAERYRGRTFIGIDFSTAKAERKWKQPNVKFIAGYARDVIGEVSNALEIGVIFASSTFVLFNPAELVAYMKAFAAARVVQIVLSEPHWFGLSDTSDGAASMHMEADLWFHRYRRYLRAVGYQIAEFEERSYKHPKSPRPDIVVTLLRAVSRVRDQTDRHLGDRER